MEVIRVARQKRDKKLEQVNGSENGVRSWKTKWTVMCKVSMQGRWESLGWHISRTDGR